jgi:hypothetical protein
MTSARNASIIRLYRDGARQADLALQFNISRDRVRQIIEQAKRSETRRAELERKYGSKPKITALPDATPIEVLWICDGRIQGWAARLEHLEYTQTIEPIRTLGDLRRVTDAELLREPNIGIKMVAELRRFCPRRNTGFGGRRYYKRGELSTKVKRRAGHR